MEIVARLGREHRDVSARLRCVNCPGYEMWFCKSWPIPCDRHSFNESNPSKQAASDLSADEQDENRHGEVDEELEAGQPDHRTGGGTGGMFYRDHLLTELWSF